MDTTLRPFQAVLRKAGFTRTFVGRSDNVQIYEKRFLYQNHRIVLDVQLWGDGHHRVSFMKNGIGWIVPTDFETIKGMKRAIARQTGRAKRENPHEQV